MKTAIILLSLLSIILLCGCVYSITILLSAHTRNAELAASLYEAKQVNNKNELINNKILIMEKTLAVCYKLSKWEARYYSIYFNDFSTHYGIPWEIYPAVIKIESAFKTSLISKKKCKGLMQLKEETGKEVAEKIGINYVPEQTLWNEFLNLPLGCTYLSTMIKDMGLSAGVRAYLAGPAYQQIPINEENKEYIEKYSECVFSEYTRLTYTYRGALAELTTTPDTNYIAFSNPKFKYYLDPFEPADTLNEFK